MAEEWNPIPIDENVLTLVGWAVDEYNKQQNAHLEFRGVWSAKLQTSIGASNYQTVLDAADGGEIIKYEAQVVVRSTNPPTRRLVEFKPIPQA